MPSIIAAAKNAGAEAIHPGYGFLAENADFARACVDNDLVFIGPAADCIERMGDKSMARETMKSCGVPTVPGSDGCIDTAAEAKAFAGQRGLSRAHQGHGGRRRQGHARGARPGRPRGPVPGCPHRGRRRVRQRRRVPGEARAAPAPRGGAGAGRRLRQQPRACASATAPCSAAIRSSSRRRPRRRSTEDLRRAMGVAAIKAVRAVNYKNAGTDRVSARRARAASTSWK